MSLPPDHNERLGRARDSLEGLSVGDAFGERFFCAPDVAISMIERRAVPASPWRWTDDTAMALSIYETLAECGGIESDLLARLFARRYAADPMRGYGGGAHRLLRAIGDGEPWPLAAAALFDGGSYGNGGAMRVAPVGAYFADDPAMAAQHARRSADPTHAHREGRAGAIAVAVAAAWCTASRGTFASTDAMFDTVLAYTPPGEVHDGITKAHRTPVDTSVAGAVERLGNGSRISAQDTVPFALWCVARHLDDFEEALWTTVAGLGDRDTTCAIVGGVLAGRLGADGVPLLWRHSREALEGLAK